MSTSMSLPFQQELCGFVTMRPIHLHLHYPYVISEFVRTICQSDHIKSFHSSPRFMGYIQSHTPTKTIGVVDVKLELIMKTWLTPSLHAFIRPPCKTRWLSFQVKCILSSIISQDLYIDKSFDFLFTSSLGHINTAPYLMVKYNKFTRGQHIHIIFLSSLVTCNSNL